MVTETNTKHNSAVYIQIAAYCVQCNHIHYCSHMHVTYCEHVCYKVIAQDESALPLTSTGPGSTNLSTTQWNGLRGGMLMLPHV